MDVQWRRVAADVLCLDDAGRILLTRFVQEGNPDSGSWTMPGGGMEWGEYPAETAVRELDEETGLRAEVGEVVGVFSRWFEPHETPRSEAGHVVGLVFGATNVRGNLRTDFRDTTDAAAWFTLDEARALRRVSLVDFCLDLC
jgi:ADP-ribose pyrophosphatase YjhB (NUDIX family)